VIAILAAGVLSPFFVEVTPEVRSSYVSLGKLIEDRPMQISFVRAGYDAGEFGRFGIRNWDVSSLTDRRHDAHRHALYHTEFGPIWQYNLALAEGWRIKSDLTRSWTMYRGFENRASKRTYHWWQIDQSLENPYVVPFCRLRKCFRGNDYIYFKAGVRKKFTLLDDFYLTPSVFAEGGSSRNQKRVLGAKLGGGEWNDGVASVSFRLELGWKISDCLTAFAFVEQYEVVGGDERRTNGASSYRCAHNDWTLGGIGLRMRF
jgi:hypothetical protein